MVIMEFMPMMAMAIMPKAMIAVIVLGRAGVRGLRLMIGGRSHVFPLRLPLAVRTGAE